MYTAVTTIVEIECADHIDSFLRGVEVAKYLKHVIMANAWKRCGKFKKDQCTMRVEKCNTHSMKIEFNNISEHVSSMQKPLLHLADPFMPYA